MVSIWSKTSELLEKPHLQADMSVDAAVIGGGMAGILTAYFLTQRGLDTVVLEGDRVGSGQTKNTTAKITAQHNVIYSKLIKDFGMEQAVQYAEANMKAISDFRSIIEKGKIDCSFEKTDSYLYSQSQEDVLTIENEVEAAFSLGIDAQFTTKTKLPFPVRGAVRFLNQAQFHPLKFINSLSQNLNIFEKTRVMAVKDQQILTSWGKVRAKHIVFATHFPFINVPGLYFARMHQERSYALALEGAVDLEGGMYLGIDADSLSFRNYKNLLILGGGGHRTGENVTGGQYDFLREKAAKYFPQSRETAHWSAQDCMTLDGVPYIGQFSASKPNWYVATGFAKWGMTSSMVAASIISDEICGVENPYRHVFSPQRFKPSVSAKTFLTDFAESVKGLSKQVFAAPKKDLSELPMGHGGIVEHEGEKIGVYKDEKGQIHRVSVQCPHLGCQLEWNPDEKSWDCPCHGSRFNYKGELLDGPAQTDLDSPEQ